MRLWRDGGRSLGQCILAALFVLAAVVSLQTLHWSENEPDGHGGFLSTLLGRIEQLRISPILTPAISARTTRTSSEIGVFQMLHVAPVIGPSVKESRTPSDIISL